MDQQDTVDLITLARNVVSLLQDHAHEEALRQISAAQAQYAKQNFDERAGVIHQINISIHRLRAEREAVCASLKCLPNDESLFAEHQIRPTLDNIFNLEIARLQTLKRRYSRPRQDGVDTD